ncbi:MAG: hypothetical protein U9Q24_04865 [Candidatus Ratteibacteria bacterium]|nr:hypothetical protein [Candidatus Ratteibacteria bacterium]
MPNKYDSKREIKTFLYLYTAAEHALKLSKNLEEGLLYQFMTSLIFSAFTLEAALNDIGERVVPFWNELERISPIQKFNVLHGYLKLPIDISQRPAQTITLLFKFRNTMAHGKTERLSGIVATENPDARPAELPSLETFWEKFCTKKQAEESLTDIKKIIKSICSAANLPEYFMETFGSESFHSI